jgi:hypothetical protein
LLTEGFPEVLGHYLYEDIARKAGSDTKVRDQMEAGLSNSPCASIPGSKIEYVPGGPNAETIRLSVGKERFRAAFFLGQLELVGIQPKRISGGAGSPQETEADATARAVTESRPVQPAVRRAPVALDPGFLDAGPGRPLEPAARRDLQNRLGQDLSQVRVHTDASAARSARAIGALAYTVGRDIVFGAGQYAPETPVGRGLIAHELTHVAQQTGAGTKGHHQ